jgi:hypothetical protein
LVRKIIFIPLGIMLGAAAIGLAYPLITGLPGADQNIIPRFASQWYVGKGAEEKPTLQYLVKTQEMEFLAELRFLEQIDDEQNIHLIIDDKKTNQHLEATLKLGKAFVFIDVPEEIKPYTHALDLTVFSVRDTVVEPKYLVVGAEWGTAYIGKFTPKLKLVEYGDTQFEFGTLKTYTISYNVNDIENKFLVSDNIPLPIRAEFYTIEGDLDYFFELIKLEGSLPS